MSRAVPKKIVILSFPEENAAFSSGNIHPGAVQNQAEPPAAPGGEHAVFNDEVGKHIAEAVIADADPSLHLFRQRPVEGAGKCIRFPKADHVFEVERNRAECRPAAEAGTDNPAVFVARTAGSGAFGA